MSQIIKSSFRKQSCNEINVQKKQKYQQESQNNFQDTEYQLNQLSKSQPIFKQKSAQQTQNDIYQKSFDEISDLYFKEDILTKQDEKENIPSKLEHAKDEELLHHSQQQFFRWGQFFITLAIHIGFFQIGPLVNIITIYICKYKAFHRNLQFWGNSGPFYFQLFTWLPLFILSQMLNYYYDKAIGDQLKHYNQYKYYINIFEFYIQIQSALTSVKYGFMPPSIFKIYKHKLISKQQLSREYLFTDWQNQTKFIIEQQLEKAILNQEVESTSFYFKFLQEIPENQFKYLLNPKAKSFFNETYKIHIDLNQYAYGPNLARQIIKAAAYAQNDNLFYLVIIGAVIRLSISLTITFMLGDKDLHNLGGLFIGTIVFIFSQFFQIMTFMEIFLYMLNGVREMNRKIFFNQQLSYLISTQKIEDYEYRKIFPSLNLANDMSLRNWFKLRAILKDYGSKYFRRFEYMLSIIVLTQVLIFLWVFISLYIESSIPKSLQITLLYESILTLGIILTLMWKGAQINQYDSQHQILILKNIKLIQDLGTNGGIFFIDGIEKQLNIDNFMLQQLVKYFKYDLQIPYKTVQLYCIQISDILNEGLQQLDYHIKYFPYSIMGINLQKDLLLKIIFTFLSLIATITYRFYIL